MSDLSTFLIEDPRISKMETAVSMDPLRQSCKNTNQIATQLPLAYSMLIFQVKILLLTLTLWLTLLFSLEQP